MGVVDNATPRPTYPRGKTRYPLYRRVGGPQNRSGRVRKILPPTGFDPRTVQPVAAQINNDDDDNNNNNNNNNNIYINCNWVVTR